MHCKSDISLPTESFLFKRDEVLNQCVHVEYLIPSYKGEPSNVNWHAVPIEISCDFFLRRVA